MVVASGHNGLGANLSDAAHHDPAPGTPGLQALAAGLIRSPLERRRYIPMRRGRLHPVAVMDGSTRKVLSWRLSSSTGAGFASRPWRRPQHTKGRHRSSPPTRAPVHLAPLRRRPEGRRRVGLHGWSRTKTRLGAGYDRCSPIGACRRAPIALPNMASAPCRCSMAKMAHCGLSSGKAAVGVTGCGGLLERRTIHFGKWSLGSPI